MSNAVQLSLLQLFKAVESTSSELPIQRLLVEPIDQPVSPRPESCDVYPDDTAFQLVLTVFENMLLRLSIEPMEGPPHRDLCVRIVCDASRRTFSAAQKAWIPRLLYNLCEKSLAHPDNITIDPRFDRELRVILEHWKQQIIASKIDSNSIVEELNEGPFRSSALDYSTLVQARDLCMKSIVLQSARVSGNDTKFAPTRSLNCKQTTAENIEESINMPDLPNYSISYMAARGNARFFDAPPPINRDVFAEMRRHVINLNSGRYSGDGEFSTSSADVRALFREHIPKWASDRPDDGPLRIVLYAHGGLTNEAWGLHTAAKQMKWWKDNGVYPVFFVWETGLWETLRQMFSDATRELGLGGTRGWFDNITEGIADGWDRLRDRTWETTTRGLGIGDIWGRMKQSAAQTFAVRGDGREVLNELGQLCASHSQPVKLHAVGHSAGSIFLAHAIGAAKRRDVPSFKSVHLLAPAITNELFKEKFLEGGRLPANVKRLSLFTMNDALELADTVGPYKKSLLYLIYYALEPERETDVLGLERSLRSDVVTEKLFGLNGRRGNANVELLFSQTDSRSGRSATQSTTHGGFDDDPATMESVLRRIKRVSDSASIVPFPRDRNRGGNPFVTATISFGSTDRKSSALLSGTDGIHDLGNRKSLCIGINDYANAPLNGCVSDASRWQQWFETQGFETESLHDEEASRDNIVSSMSRLFRNSRPGDVIAIQFAGHGTQVPDDDGDERHGDTPGLDEAFVPHDFEASGFLVDDDIARCCESIPRGVSVTFFMDCCHSGTATRFFISRDSLSRKDARPRFMTATADMVNVHRAARQQRGITRKSAYKSTSEILFSACRSNEVAWESDGQGDFTRHALAVLSQVDVRPLTCREFADAVSQRFQSDRRQTPELCCDTPLESTVLLASRGTPVSPSRPQRVSCGTPPGESHLRSVLNEVRTLLESI